MIKTKGILEPKKGSTQVKEQFPVLEMTCAACAVSVESMLKSAEGVSDAGVNFASQEAWVQYDPAQTSPRQLQQTVRSIGYDLIIEKENRDEQKEMARLKQLKAVRIRFIGSALLSLPVLILGMIFMNLPHVNWIMLVLSAPVVFYFGRGFFVNAWKQARHGRANMDTLVALSTGVAWLFSVFNTVNPEFWHRRGIHPHVYFEAAAVVIAFISLGKWLEERAKSSTNSALRKLMGLQPKTVMRVQSNGSLVEVKIEDIQPGDIILVKPGEKIAVDGEVTEGDSYVDESLITGEPIPVRKEAGQAVFAGTINQKGSFRFQARKVGGETVLAQIIKMVREAQESKPPVQNLVDKIAGIFVPIVIAISIITFAAWMIWGGSNAFTHALLAAVTVLVIACPCALGLATPTAIMVGIGKGAEHNILIKNAESLELAQKIDAVVLDKTGTITEGRPRVTDRYLAPGTNEKMILELILGIEQQSEHPLAEAIVQDLTAKQIQPAAVQAVQSETGMGIRASWNGETYRLGNLSFVQQLTGPLPDEFSSLAAQWQQQAKTVIYVSRKTEHLAMLAIADTIKPQSPKAIADLQQQGIAVYMLTGDNAATAAAIARQTGVAHVKAEVMPAAKAEFIKELQQQGKKVAMVGDGINDSQALAQADVGIAMGKGSDIAMDVAQMTLITSDLGGLLKAFRLSKQTLQTIRQNLFWAFIYNIIGIPIAAGLLYPVNGFLLNPMVAGAAMAFSSVSVVSNSLRLKLRKL